MKKTVLLFYTIFIFLSCSKEASQQPTPQSPSIPSNPTTPTATAPKITLASNAAILSITPLSGKLFYTITDFGGANLTANGLCWSTSPNPTINNDKSLDSIATLNYSINGSINNLKPQTKYFVRAFATNSVGTSYSSELNFTTDSLYGCFANPVIFKNEIFSQKLNDGKILVSSSVSSNELNNNVINTLIRLNADGTMDNSFNFNQNFNGIGYLRGKYKILIQSDGKYIASYNENGVFKFTRINTNGSVDNSFQTTITSTLIYDMEIQNDDKILLLGNILGGNKLIRLNSNGTVDNTFTPYNVTFPRAVSFGSDGKILIGAIGGLVRLNNDGSVDNSFKSSIKMNLVYHISKISGNKFLIHYDDNTTNSFIERINSDGSKDASFKTIILNYLNLYFIGNIESDNNIYIGGQFSKINNEDINGFARFSLDGTIDKTLNVGSGFIYSGVLSGNNLRISTSFLASDKKIIVSGGFDKYNGKKIKWFTKINSDGSICLQ